jgi:RNA polymerase sigma factor (sigma-70 family)
MAKAPNEPSDRSRRLADLLARVKLGDRAAFGEMYDMTSSPLLGIVLKVQRNRAVAEEVLQEVYVNIWRAAASFDASMSQPMTWLASIARNRAIDSLRRAQTQPHTVSTAVQGTDDDEEHDLMQDFAAEGGDPLELLGQAAEQLELDRCMRSLTSEQKQSLALAFYQGLSHAEVAEHLQQPLGTVKSWVRRALQSLKSCLSRAAQQTA